jgi:hypothetical protein
MVKVYHDDSFMYYDGFKGKLKSAVLYYMLGCDWLVAFEHNLKVSNAEDWYPPYEDKFIQL